MSWSVASRRCAHAARLPVVVAVLAGTLVLPGAASAVTNPGTVELFDDSVNYTARAGEANDVSVSFEPDQVTLTDAVATLNAGTGCHPGSSIRQVVCTTEDAALVVPGQRVGTARAAQGLDVVGDAVAGAR